MIDIRKLKELVRLMVANDLTELDLRDTEEQVTLRRHGDATPVITTRPVEMAAPVAVAAPAAAAPATATATAAPDTDAGLARIESPMVGTFYSRPDPESSEFVTVGTHVTADTVVCLIEAMKIFNEIKAECSGTIRRMLVKNAESVEFGQPLFLVEPD